MKRLKRCLAVFSAMAMALSLSFAVAERKPVALNAADYPVVESGAYTTMEEVAVYLTRYGHLPDNFITKKQAQALGWDSRQGNLAQVAPGKSIGGDYFGNYEGSVPDARGRNWTECDIDADGGYRNGQRIVFSSDGLIYYSDDHYQTFREVSVTVPATPAATQTVAPAKSAASAVAQGEAYLSRDDVAAYLHQFGALPPNYLTRDAAKALGWNSKKDNLAQVAPGCAIGGDSFGNREGLLPAAKGREWHECDVNVTDGHRSDERLAYSNDGMIYYTPDKHKSFEQLY